MRVAYVSADPGVPVFGCKGCSIHVQEVVRAMRNRGAAVELFVTRTGGDPPPDLAAIPLHQFPLASNGDPANRERRLLAANEKFRKSLKRAGPFDMVYERYSLWSHAAMEHAREVGIPGILEVNAPLIEEQTRHRGLTDERAARHVAARAFDAAAALLAVSDEVAAYLKCHPATRERIHVVPNGVAPYRFLADLEPSLPREPGDFTIGFVGTLKPWHGLPLLLEVFARLHQSEPGFRLLIVGDGPERARLAADVAARGDGLAQAVHITGAVAPADVPGLIASMDVATAPYRGQPEFYFSPLKVYEYMAAGRAIVASRVGQLAQVIRDGVNGLLCAPGDVPALVEAIAHLRRDPAFRRRLGQTARSDALESHTWDAVVGRVFDIADRHPGGPYQAGGKAT